MFHTIYLDERVALTPSEVNTMHNADDVKKIILQKLREKHEGKCNANGYVRPESIELLARSMGVAENGRFTGNLLYDCKIKCEVLYPTTNTIVEGIVLKVNKMGAYVVFEEAIRILLPRDLHLGDTSFDALKEGETVKVRIERSRFQTNDPYIMSVGKLAKDEPIAE
jgi:DNA-directed RNA polymerase subunit E'/Rpb7